MDDFFKNALIKNNQRNTIYKKKWQLKKQRLTVRLVSRNSVSGIIEPSNFNVFRRLIKEIIYHKNTLFWSVG